MTTYYLSANRGEFHAWKIAVGTSVPSTDFYLAWSSTNNPTKLDVQLFIRMLDGYISSNGLGAGQTGVDIPKL